MMTYKAKKYMKTPLKTHKKTAPRIPSSVFLGEIPFAKEVLPNRFPNSSPPLSAYHERQKLIAMNLGL
jgi:hypothetical protein